MKRYKKNLDFKTSNKNTYFSRKQTLHQDSVDTSSHVLTLASIVSTMFRQQPEDLDVTRNNEATNEFQAKTIELRAQRPQWITYHQ